MVAGRTDQGWSTKQSSSWYDRVWLLGMAASNGFLSMASGYGNLGMATWVWLGGRSMGGALGVNSPQLAPQWPLLPEQPWQAVTRQRAGGHQLLLAEVRHCLRG